MTLKTAAGVIEARARQHGNARITHERIAQLWNAYLDVVETDALTARDVAQMMVLLKIARAMDVKEGCNNADNFIDMAGYAALAGSLWRD